MTVLVDQQVPGGTLARDEVPLRLATKPTGGDRVFAGILASSSAASLVVLLAAVAFLCYFGYPALHAAGFGLVTDKSWSPSTGQFGVLPLLVGSVAIAVIAVIIATPISLSTALMINQYGPRRLKPVLTAVVDMLATVPSIVYGFWGLLLVSNLQAAPAKWLAHHAAFIPIFRTYSPTPLYVKSIFACGLICAVTIIPIITSVSREVMAQAPVDVCEAALGLGGTRWGMVTEVVFPFSRNGILGAILLAFGRGLGETMIVVLVLSPGNHLTGGLLGPGGLGSIADQITSNFVTSSGVTSSALILLGLVLFLTTMAVNIGARLILQRANA
jgi:phosphate transport system permease protein